MTVFDCVLFVPEIDALTFRLEELDGCVDVFVIVEVLDPSTPAKRHSELRSHWSALKPWAHRLRHVVVTPPRAMDLKTKLRRRVRAAVPNPLLGLEHIGRGLADLQLGDTILLSNLEDVPSPSWVDRFASDDSSTSQRFVVSDSGSGSKAASNLKVGGLGLRVGSASLDRPSRQLKKALGAGPGPHDSAEIGRQAPNRGAGTRSASRSEAIERDRRPVLICPYLHDGDAETVRKAFGLDDARGKSLPAFLWQDTNMIGPERAFEYCWNQFPDRDVIIIHPDMWPTVGDDGNAWYEKLCAYADELPDAGAIGLDLIFPNPTKNGGIAAQHVGGRIRGRKISHVGGLNHEYDDRYAKVRRVDWATFGGVLIRREAIDMVGSFDDRYQWAYVMDVDYCMEIQLRGLRIYQVPVNIIHDQNGTTRDFLDNPEFKQKVLENEKAFADKWSPLLRGTPREGPEIADYGILKRFPGG